MSMHSIDRFTYMYQLLYRNIYKQIISLLYYQKVSCWYKEATLVVVGVQISLLHYQKVSWYTEAILIVVGVFHAVFVFYYNCNFRKEVCVPVSYSSMNFELNQNVMIVCGAL
jgi:hypothetical protein